MLPKISGIEILERMREKRISTPVIMLSALSEVEDKVRGLNSGADDYLAKPFKTAELVARINALARRPAKVQDRKISFLNLEYNIDERELNGVRMTTKEADIMHELLKTPEKVVKKEYLLSKVWGGEAYGEDNYIEVYISRLRKLLKTLHSEAKIMTIRGFGYKLVKE
jgi:DNA-binding response OmpR family regulator